MREASDNLIELLVRALGRHEAALERGAFIDIDEPRWRLRVVTLVE